MSGDVLYIRTIVDQLSLDRYCSSGLNLSLLCLMAAFVNVGSLVVPFDH